MSVSTVNTKASPRPSSTLVTEQISHSLIRSLWWLMLSAELFFITIYLAAPFVNSWGNPGLWRVGSVFLWTVLCRLVFWQYSALGASVVLIGIMFAIPWLVTDEGQLFNTAFARLTVLSLPALFLSFLWGWRGVLACVLSSVLVISSSKGVVSEETLIGLVLFLTTMLCGAYIHHLLIGMQRVQLELKNLAMRDALTKLGNRYALETDFQGRIGVGCLSMWDVNGLKRINDQHGHLAGDQYLLQFVAVYNAATTDPLYRVGGDEFVGLHRSVAELLALRETVLRGFPNVSSGWTDLGNRNIDAVLRDADAVMYGDKHRRTKQHLLAMLEQPDDDLTQ